MKAVFITGTGTDIGKTYVSAYILKSLTAKGLKAAYYKPALSGAQSLEHSDAGFVINAAGLRQELKSAVGYWFKEPLSPHLAAQHENVTPSLEHIRDGFERLALDFDYVLVEGAGGIYTPLYCPSCPTKTVEDARAHKRSIVLYSAVAQELKLPVLVVADAGLGTINHTVLTTDRLKALELDCKGVILNNFKLGNLMHEDNLGMIEALAQVPVVATLEHAALEHFQLGLPGQVNFEEYFAAL
ncbi:MAG: dethiobiotin synthase [Succinivibrio sp.]|nr:dethiobiotin synthase [Succinivibrio sp.]